MQLFPVICPHSYLFIQEKKRKEKEEEEKEEGDG